jgi:Zn-dependent protease
VISLLFTNPIEFFIAFGGLLVSLTVHEFAHAWVADRLGDPTPRMQGRVTLNPLAHLDPMGTLLLLFTRFGWGKPVEIDPFNLKHPVRDSAMIALAGPAVNLTVAAVLALVLRTVGLPEVVGLALLQVIIINVVLAIFNLVPVHPLDGSKILVALLPRHTALEYELFMHRYGVFVLLCLLIPWTGGASPISHLITPVISFVTQLLFI